MRRPATISSMTPASGRPMTIEAPGVKSQQVLWGLTLAVVTCALIWVGGVTALQAASIVIGLPLAGVMLLMGAGLLKDLVTHKL